MSAEEKPESKEHPAETFQLPRRSILQVIGAAFGAAMLPEVVACGTSGDGPYTAEDALTVTGTVQVIRPHDLLVLTISFVNLKQNRVTGNLVQLVAGSPSQIILDLPPQAILEDATTIQASGSDPTTDSIPTIFSRAMLGGPTRLVFNVPLPYTAVPYSLANVLTLCAKSSVVVTPSMASTLATVVPTPSSAPSGDPIVDRMLATALAPTDPAASGRSSAFNSQLPSGLTAFQGTGVTMSGGTQPQGLSDGSVTQIELPYRMKLSPNALAGFVHAATPVQGVTSAYEVWHTILGVRGPTGAVDERNSYLRTARAIWTRDWDLGGLQPSPIAYGVGAQPITNPSLQVAQREAIVVNSSGAPGASPVQLNRLMLSSLGGYLDARGDWPNTSTENGVSRWVHKMTGGRENFVEVDIPGYLLPFGNSATCIQITRRNDNPALGPIGELYSYNLIIVGNPVTTYRAGALSTATANTLLRWPFVAVELKKTHFVTQRINANVTVNGVPNAGTAVWPTDATGSPILVPCTGYDRRGRAVHFDVPLFFTSSNVPAATGVSQYYGAIQSPPTNKPRTTSYPAVGSAPPDANNPYQVNPSTGTKTPSLVVPMRGQRIAYADSKTTGATTSTQAPPKDDTSFATQWLAFDILPVTTGDSFQQPVTPTPQFAPVVTTANIFVEALHQYLPAQADGTMPPVDVWYHPRFVSAPGFDATNNKSHLLFQLASMVTADFTKDPSGGNRSDGGTGFVAPNMTFNSLSRKTGPSYDGSFKPPVPPTGFQNPNTSDGAFDPSVYLGMASTALSNIKILGVFSILDIVKTVAPSEANADLAGLVSSAEEAALKYAPKIIAQGLSELEKIVALIAEVKSQVELVYTNAQELLGPNYTSGAGTGTLSKATGLVVNGAATAASTVAAQIAPVLQAAKAFYGTSPTTGLQATITAIESLDLNTLAGPATTNGSILQLIQNATALVNAVQALTNYGARAAQMPAQAIAVNGATTSALQGTPVGSLSNAMIQIASGVQQSLNAKLNELLSLLGAANGAVLTASQIYDDFNQLFQAAQQALDVVRDMTVKIEWQPKVGSFGPSGWTIFRPATQHALTLMMEVRAKATDSQSAGVDLSCRIDHFDICIGQTSDGNGGTQGIVGLQFDHISLDVPAGHKPDVDVKINGITFGGPLSFLETLKKLIPMDGFSDPPYVHVTADGIKAGFTLQIPNVAVGMFSLENLAISAELDVPFFTTGSAGSALTFTFSFCDKDHPFVITVSLLGGGGYFTVTLTPNGLQHLEASISVGAQLAINLLDIAQGSVSIMAGITFTIDDSSGTEDVSLTAFLRLHGELDILGIITISITLSVSMTFDFTHKMIVAEAEIHVEVSIVFFSINVDLPFRKEFHSCNNDPTLRQLMPPGASNAASAYWAEYVGAYA
jgi:hypothetical protein